MTTDNHVIGDFSPAVTALADTSASLINRIADTTNSVGHFFEGSNQAISFKGLPHLDLTGFDQEATHKSEGVISDAWHGIKSLFGKDDTLQEKLKEKVEKEMNPDEKKQFEKENKALDDYQSKLLGWETLMTINPGPMPMPPETPMHKEIDKRVEAMEKDITDSVRSKMSPEDRGRLDKQFKDYEKGVAESQHIRNPLCTGELFKRPPEPGNAIKDYFDRVKEETERRLNS